MWSGVGAWFGGIWEGIVSAAKWASDGIASAWQGLVGMVSTIWGEIKSVIAAAIDSLAAIAKAGFEIFSSVAKVQFTAIKTAVSVVFEAIKAFLSAWVNAIKAILTAGVTVFASVFNAGFGLIKTAFSTAFNVIKALARGDMQAVATAIRAGLTQAVSIVRTMISNIVAAFKNLGSQLLQAGRDAIQGFINGVRQKMSEALNVARDMANSVANTVKSALNIQSPSRVMRELGGYVGEGLALGIKDKQKDVQKQAEALANTVKSAFADLHKQAFMLDNADNPLADALYRTQFGDLAGASDKEKDDYLNATRALKDFAELQERTKAVTGNIHDLQRQIALFHDNSAIAQLNYDIANTGKYAGVAESELAKLKTYTTKLDILQTNKQACDKALNDFNNLSNNGFGGLQTATPMDKLRNEYSQKMVVIDEFERLHTDKLEQAEAQRQLLMAQYSTAKNDLMLQTYENGFGAAVGIMKSAFGEQSGIYRAMFAMEKGYALARVLLANKESIAKAWASAPFPKNLPVVASTLVQTGALQSAIGAIRPIIGQAHDGIMSVPKSGTWNLEKGERVLPRHTAQNLDNTLNRLQGGGGGQVINVSVTVNADSSDVQSSYELGKNLGNAIKVAVQAELQKEFRQGGKFYGR